MPPNMTPHRGFDGLISPADEWNVSACSKAILVGEHAVVYGARAVAIPLPGLRLELRYRLKSSASLRRDHESTVTRAQSNRISEVFEEANQLIASQLPQMHISGNHHFPFGAGMGSSAALCVGTIRAVSKISGQRLTNQQISRFANILERRFHGNPSGLDTTVVTYEQPVVFSKDRPMELLQIRGASQFHFALIDSGVRASTKSMVHLAAPYFSGAKGLRRIDAFDKLALSTKSALETGDLMLTARCMNQAHQLLTATGVVTEVLSSIIQKCRAMGCLAAKSTGAGGGGVILALLDPSSHRQQLERLKATFGHQQVYVSEALTP